MSVQEIRAAWEDYHRWSKTLGKDLALWPKGWTGAMQAETAEYWVFLLGQKAEAILMAAKAAPKPARKQPEFKGFVNYVLSDVDKEAYKVWSVDDHDLFLLLAGELTAGYKFSCSYNSQNDTHVATFMCNDDSNPNAGYCLSAYAPDPYHALKTLMFKHVEVLGSVWGGEKVKEAATWG